MQYLAKSIGLLLNSLSFFSKHLAGTLALQLFTTPFKGTLTKSNSEFLKTATYTKKLELQKLKISTYVWEGSAKKILVAHGWESNAARWQKLMQYLASKNYTFIALDAPAHGASTGSTFNAILYSKCIATCVKKYQPEIIIGHSVGGMASVFFLHENPNSSVQQLITLGAPSNFEGVFNRYVQLMQFNKKIEQAMYSIVKKRFGNAPSYYSAEQFCKNITIPCVLLHDKKDKIIPFTDAEDYHQNFKKSTLIPVEKSGHSLNNEIVFQAIKNFITKLE